MNFVRTSPLLTGPTQEIKAAGHSQLAYTGLPVLETVIIQGSVRVSYFSNDHPTVGESPHIFLFCSLNAQVYTYTQHVHRSARNAHVRRSSWTTQSG